MSQASKARKYRKELKAKAKALSIPRRKLNRRLRRRGVDTRAVRHSGVLDGYLEEKLCSLYAWTNALRMPEVEVVVAECANYSFMEEVVIPGMVALIDSFATVLQPLKIEGTNAVMVPLVQDKFYSYTLHRPFDTRLRTEGVVQITSPLRGTRQLNDKDVRYMIENAHRQTKKKEERFR